MIVLPSGDVVSDDEDEFAEMSPLIDEGEDSEVEVEATSEQVGVALVARRALATQVKKVDEAQRDNIFYTRCHVKGRVCSLIIDAGSCTNVASTLMVDHLSLPTLRHPNPYRLQWLNEAISKSPSKWWCLFGLGSMRTRSFATSFQCKLLTFCWDGHGNMTRRLLMMALPTNTPCTTTRR
mgnify:CR=1 FL=1